MFRVVIVYDIHDDRCRTKVCDACLDYGLDRHQYSVFTGQLKKRQIHALKKELVQLTRETGYVVVIPVAADDWDRRLEIGSPIHVR